LIKQLVGLIALQVNTYWKRTKPKEPKLFENVKILLTTTWKLYSKKSPLTQLSQEQAYSWVKKKTIEIVMGRAGKTNQWMEQVPV